ncbi:MAG TPA: YggS family pyridoxal phosphate-dependent enzyme [Rhodocyclaceae bacterium]|nr:YggS family pyridoxal phosphate-dependent enzyme [Rhodocyclaceae bacterium]HRQ45884.1 YggS family pyridoxal phosphate-dependent enzyme [Rhodocyclaceae bacterium]
MTSISANLQAVRERVDAAARAVGRTPDEVVVLAVSKTRPVASILEAARAGQHAFGENYVQEGVAKIEALRDRRLEWHFVGPLQSNKSRAVAMHFDWVHSVDRSRLAERLSAQRDATFPALNVCIQVNVSGEASKSGVAPDDVLSLAEKVAALPRLRLRGLMCIPEPDGDPEVLHGRFRTLRRLLSDLNARGFSLDTLSMGMSDDLEVAIAEGSTLVRVGTAIFGVRTKSRD